MPGRRTLPLIAGALLVTLSSLTLALAQTYPTDGQLLVNPGFDTDADENGVPDGWSTSPERALLREKVFMGGDRELVSIGNTYVLATQPIKLEPGETYTVAFRARGAGGGTAGALIVHGKEKPTREMPLMWNIALDEEYAEYWAPFKAPNPVAVLYIYNVAKKGQVSYDWVSLIKGKPDRAYVRQFRFGERDDPDEDPVILPHTPWATPLSGGPIKAMVALYNYRTIRELVELSQRLDLDYDAVEGGYTGESLCSPTGRRLMRRLNAGEYEVYVVASRLDERLEKEIRAKVEAGAGLVVISGFGRLGNYCDKDDLQVADEDHYLRRDLPWSAMPSHILNEVRFGKLGEGRVAWLNFPTDVARVWGVWPVENDHAAYMSREMRYWEYWHAFIARAIHWAARGESGIKVELATSAQEPALRITGAPEGATADVAIRHSRELRFGAPDLKYPAQSAPAGNAPVTVGIPADAPDGQLLADLTVRDAKGGALYWGSLLIDRPQQARIAELTLDREYYEPGDTVTATVTCDPVAEGLQLRARLADAYGRAMAEAEQPAGEATALRISPPADQILCVGHKLFVQLLRGEHEVDSAWTDVYFPRLSYEGGAQDFQVTCWGDGFTNPIVSQQYSRMLADLGLNGKFGSWPYVTTEFALVPAVGSGIGGVFWPGKPTGDGVRHPCLSDPATIEKYTTDATGVLPPLRKFGVFAVNLQDEATLANRHERYEVCFSEYCQARYRKWLKNLYGDVAALNAEWGTNYADFDDITGARTEDVRGTGNFAPFVDFRTFMTDVWVEAMRRVTESLKVGMPETRIGHTNTFGSMPTNGVDYYKLCTQTGFGWAQEYSEAIKGSAHKAVFDLWRSFCPPDFPNYGWIGYDHRHEAVTYEPWWLALHGSRGVSYYACNSVSPERGKSWALIYPTQAYTPYSRDVKETITDLREGVGKLLMEYDRVQPQVALLWSHPSMLVAWCESTWDQPVPPEGSVTDSYGSYFKSAFYFRLLLNELQLTCNYVAPPQILDGGLEKYKMLFLPFTAAISDEVGDKLLDWVQAGGTLIADMRLARTDEHGKPRDTDLLERLMAVRRTAPEATYESGQVTVSDGRTFETSARETIEAVGGAQVIGKHADGTPALVRRKLGRGATIYLNFLLPKYDPAAVKMLEALLVDAGVERPVVVNTKDPDNPARAWECARFRRGEIELVGLIRDHRLVEQPQSAAVEFDRTAHVFDLRARTGLGEARAVESTLAPGEAKVYALLPYNVTGIDLALGEEWSYAVALQGTGQVGDHVLHISLTDPKGNRQRAYDKNVLAVGGKYESRLPFALNDGEGEWTLTIRDVLTGVTAQARVSYARAPR